MYLYRSAFDLTQHTKATGVRLCAEKKLPEPVTKDVTEIVPNKGPLGKAFKKEAKAVTDRLAGLSLDEITKMESELESGMASLSLGDSTVSLSKDMVAVKRYQKTVHVEEIIPSVIEPSFGVGRIMYALFEHNFRVGSHVTDQNVFVDLLKHPGKRRGRGEDLFLTSTGYRATQVTFICTLHTAQSC